MQFQRRAKRPGRIVARGELRGIYRGAQKFFTGPLVGMSATLGRVLRGRLVGLARHTEERGS